MKQIESIVVGVCAVVAASCLIVAAAVAEVVDSFHPFRNAKDVQGTYEGMLPCADCSGVHVVLELRENGTYKLSQTYIGKDGPFVDQGVFEIKDKGNVIVLSDYGRSFHIDDENTLEQLDIFEKPVRAPYNMKLHKMKTLMERMEEIEEGA